MKVDFPIKDVKIFDKYDLNCVNSASPDYKPHPNALPVLFFHGLDPFHEAKTTDPNTDPRYQYILQDFVAMTKGVYRPVFVSYNQKNRVGESGLTVQKIFYDIYLNKPFFIKGLPSNPSNPACGTFPYVDTFGYCAGGVVSRIFNIGGDCVHKNVHNMVMVGTPNHGTLNFIGEDLIIITTLAHPYAPGLSDFLSYQDDSYLGQIQNPFLFSLNSKNNCKRLINHILRCN